MSEDPKPRRRWFLRALLIAAAAFVVMAGLFVVTVRKIRRNMFDDANFVTLENQSGKMLEAAVVSVGGQTVVSTGGLGPNQRHSGHFRGTGLFVVEGTFSDGTILHAEHAGVPAGFVNTNFRLVIQPDGSLQLD